MVPNVIQMIPRTLPDRASHLPDHLSVKRLFDAGRLTVWLSSYGADKDSAEGSNV